jgi:protein-tyrosine phosphatase
VEIGQILQHDKKDRPNPILRGDIFAMKYNILFVCTGNICRSPTAEGIMRHMISERNLGHLIGVDSAGTHDYHVNMAPDKRAIAVAQSRGINLATLKARHFTPQDFNEFDLIFAMDTGHLDFIRQMQSKLQGTQRATLSLFLDSLPAQLLKDVPDPYYGDMADFKYVYDLIYETCDAIMADIYTKF